MEADLQTQTGSLLNSMLEKRPPLGASKRHGAGRNILRNIHQQHAANTYALHGFQVCRDPLTTNVAIQPKPIYPRSCRIWRVCKALFESVLLCRQISKMATNQEKSCQSAF